MRVSVCDVFTTCIHSRSSVLHLLNMMLMCSLFTDDEHAHHNTNSHSQLTQHFIRLGTCLKALTRDETPSTRPTFIHAYKLFYFQNWYSCCCRITVVKWIWQPICFIHAVFIIIHFFFSLLHSNQNLISYFCLYISVCLCNCRYIYVCHAPVARTWCTMPRVRKSIVYIGICAILHQSTRFFDR